MLQSVLRSQVEGLKDVFMRYPTRILNTLTRVVGDVPDTVIEVGSADRAAADKAVRLLRDGGVVALPTDTIYGVAADAKCDSAVQRLYKIKGRDFDKPVAICVGETEDVKRWGRTDDLPPNLLGSLLPGPVTLLLKRLETVSSNLNPGVDKVGIRVPDSDFIRRVASGLGSAVALTSANLTGETSTLAVEEFKHMWPQLSGVFDAGHLGESRAGSTIVDLTEPGSFLVVRAGSALQNTIGKLVMFGLKQRYD